MEKRSLRASIHNKGGDNMTDSEKLDLIFLRLEKLDKLENDVTDIKLMLEIDIRDLKALLA